MRCHQTFQKSLDCCCSSLCNPVRCVPRCIFCSSNGSPASPVVLKPCIHPYIHAYTRLCIAICIQRLGLHYVMGGGWELSKQLSMRALNSQQVTLPYLTLPYLKLCKQKPLIIYCLRLRHLEPPTEPSNTRNTHFPCKIGRYSEERLSPGTPMGP